MNFISKIFTREAAALIAVVSFALTPTFAFAHEADAEVKGDAGINISGITKGVLINADGNVLVGGATVTDVSGSNITARTSLGAFSFPWTIHTSSTTKTSGVSAVADIKSGDTISFSGVIDGTSNVFSVMAKAIRDFTNVAVSLRVHGTVKSVDSAHNSFVVETPEKGSFTVTTNSSTDIKKADSTLLLSQIAVGDSVTVTGTTTSASALTASKVKVTERNNSVVDLPKNLWDRFEASLWTHFKIGHKGDKENNDQNDD